LDKRSKKNQGRSLLPETKLEIVTAAGEATERSSEEFVHRKRIRGRRVRGERPAREQCPRCT
jgi:hypothetical protein